MRDVAPVAAALVEELPHFDRSGSRPCSTAPTMDSAMSSTLRRALPVKSTSGLLLRRQTLYPLSYGGAR